MDISIVGSSQWTFAERVNAAIIASRRMVDRAKPTFGT
jgi:hypothetical protein